MAGHGPPGGFHMRGGEHQTYPWLNQTPMLQIQPLHMQFHPGVPVQQIPPMPTMMPMATFYDMDTGTSTVLPPLFDNTPVCKPCAAPSTLSAQPATIRGRPSSTGEHSTSQTTSDSDDADTKDLQTVAADKKEDEESEEVETEYSSSESEPEILPDSARRSRRPVERYQIIHDYRGNKNQWEKFPDTKSSKVGRPRKKLQEKPVHNKISPKARKLSGNSQTMPDNELPSVEDDVRLIKEAAPPSSIPTDPLPDLLASATQHRRRSSTEEATQPSLSGRRRVCQTDFFQVAYPQPKRRKSVDLAIPLLTKVDKKSRKSESSNTPSKGWKGKSNLLDSSPSPTTAPQSPKPQTDDVKTINDSKAGTTEEKGEPLTDGRTVGRIVWAKLTARCKAWPAMTIRGSDAAQSPASADNQWVFWFGEHKVSEVQLCRLQDFDTAFKSAFKLGSGTLYTTAVLQALTDCWKVINPYKPDKESSEATSPAVQPDDMESYLEWAEKTFLSDETSVLPHGTLTESVGMKLADIVDMINNAEDSSEEEDDKDQTYKPKKSKSSNSNNNPVKKNKEIDREAVVSKIKSEELNIEEICLSCGGRSQEQHPLFEGGVCESCKEPVKESFFSFGADGCMSYCVVCGSGGELLVCDSEVCGRTYCKHCIALYGSEDILRTIEECDPWSCFLCDKQAEYLIDKLLIKPRDNWRQRLMRCYQKPSKLHNLPECKPDRKLRVMSLFDGIGTAKVVIDNLNLDIEVYYSVEIEEDAIQVVDLNHGDSVIHLGDIRSLTEEKLAELGRIDLLVGGSPCNDLALVNPARKGLYDATGTGILFFDFYRILMTLMGRQEDPVLWLFENVVHMNKETRHTICRFLECEPVKLDAGVFSAQSRARYFWGNIPGMFSPVSPEMKTMNISLQDMLGRGRCAAVNKIRTVTTRGASLLQGKNEDMHAVVMNGQSDKLWPTELEKIFGLPVHYTDAGNLAPGKRQKLLGRSWCVPVIEYILKPLTHLFAVRKTPPKTCCNTCCCGKGGSS